MVAASMTWPDAQNVRRRRPAAPPGSARQPLYAAAIDELAEGEREVFGLVRIQGMTQAEAARVLGVSPETVKQRCFCRTSVAAGSRCARSRRSSMRRLSPGS